MRLVIFAALALATTTLYAQQQVYRSVDEQGNVVYSDRPEGQDAEPVFIAVRRPPGNPVGIAQPRARAGASESAQQENLAAEMGAEPTAAQIAEQRARNCEIARERLELTLTSRRLYRTTAEGERQYLDEEEIDAARERAMADVETWCG